MRDHDVVIVGGGVMGCATAFHLMRLEPSLSVVVVEKDSTYEFASTLRSDGNVRIQFNLEENILISRYAMEVLETFADNFTVGEMRPDPAARHQGNLFMVDRATEASAREGMGRQRQLGCDVDWLSAAQVAESYPPYRSEGLVGGTLGWRDGSVDPAAVLRGYRAKAEELDAAFVEATVTRLLAEGGTVAGVELASGERLDAPVVINAAGAWAAGLAATIGVDLPIDPVMRTVHTVAADLDWHGSLPSIFLPSGVYVLPEHENTFLIAWSLPSDPIGFDFTFSRHRFDEVIWPELVAHLPAFDRLRVTGGWTGLYAVNTLDGNAILGEWPELAGLYLANGFSGHGFQQCHAVGRYLAELITDHPLSLDLARLGPGRIMEGRPLREHAGRLI